MKLTHLLPWRRRANELDMSEELKALEQIAPRRELGNLTRAAEDVRAVWGWPALEGVLADVRFAFRTLRKQPSFASVAVISLALAIGANAAIFSLMDVLLWRDLPVRDPERLVAFGKNSRSYPVYSGLVESAQPVMESVAAFSPVTSVQLDAGSGPQQGSATFVTGNYFQTLGVAAALGREITPDDDRRGDPAPVAVLSQDYWRRAYAGDRSALGRSLRLGKTNYTIIGIAPAEFFGHAVGEVPDVWIPVATMRNATAEPNLFDAGNNFLLVIGRLRREIPALQAGAMLGSALKRFDSDHNGPVVLEPAASGTSSLRARFSKPLRVVFGMVAIGLLLACVNVMSLQFARMDERRKELTVRLAIGASRFRVARQLLIESLLLAVASGAIGLAIYRPISAGLAALISTIDNRPVHLNLGIGPRMLLFLLGVSLTTALLSGLFPALRATGGDVQPDLQQGSRTATSGLRRRKLGRAVAAIQLALSLVLVAGACLFVFSLHRLRTMDVGMNRERLLVVDANASGAGYKRDSLGPLNRRLRERLSTVPGVEAAIFAQDGLYSGTNYDDQIQAGNYRSSKARDYQALADVVGPHYFSMIGARMIAGREFDASDRSDPNVVVVNQELARHFFGASNPVGQVIHLSDGFPFRVLGVVQDIRGENLRRTLRPRFYAGDFQTRIQPFTARFLVRAKANPLAVVSGLREAVRQEDSALAVQIASADELLDRTLDIDRLIATLAWGFGVLAILLAAVGIYGLFSYEVTRRTAEIGIRVAVGAAQRDILGMILREVALICIAGVAVGTAAALALSRVATSLVFGVKPDDPRIAAAAAIILVAAAVCAAWLPARRAARLDPMIALRVD
jgi:predicted permease